MGWENIKTKQKGMCLSYDEIRNFFSSQSRDAIYCGHNIIKFDAPVLNRLAGTRLSPSRVADTLVLSTLYSPSLDGGHSLEAWGDRLGFPKGKHSDWSKLSAEMISYCEQDVALGAQLFRRLTKVLSKIGFSEKSCYIQHHITGILDRQHKNGFKFDGERALGLLQHLRAKERQLEESVRDVFASERLLVREGNLRTKTGQPTAIFERDRLRYHIEQVGGGKYRAYEDVQFNLGSPKQRVDKLLELGWEPEEFTPKTKKGGGGSPKPFEKGDLSPSLQRFLETKDVPEVALIAKWMAFNGRANMINTWLDNWDERDGCIHGKLFVADTLRFRHQAPNTANIPAVRERDGAPLLGELGYYTYEARDLWTARAGRTLVGTDAAGLELRMLAHYINDRDFSDQVLSGDPHQFNADLAGVTRPVAKTLLYAVQYGAQGPKVAKIIGSTVKEGVAMRQKFLDRLGITDVMNAAIQEQEVGRVWLVDGSGVVCPSPHAALNYRLQGGGARVMALGSIILEGHIRRAGLDSLKVGDVHDEWIYDVSPEDAERHRELSLLSLKEAGEELNLNVPIDGNSLIGPTWAHVH